MANEIKLGGGVAQAVALRGVNTTENMTGNNELSSIVSGLNSMIQNLGQAQARKELIRNEEDKVRAVNKAEIEHYDVTNALSEASYDQSLNNEVSQWRANGLMDSEIRTKIKDYKFNKMVQDSGLGQDGGRSADSADMAFFDTFTKLEMKAVAPMIQEDRKVVQSRINNMTSSYVMNSDEPLQDKYNNVVTTNKSYGMGEEEATLHIINTAFNKARRGDDSLLKELQGVTTSTGEKLIDTVKGADIYNKLTDNLMAKKEHDLAVSRKEEEYQKEVTATKLYTDYIDTKDLSGFKLNIDNALQSGYIGRQEHHSLLQFYKSASSVGEFPKQSDGKAFAESFTRGVQGTLTIDYLSKNASKFSSSDFQELTKLSVNNSPDTAKYKGAFTRMNDLAEGLKTQISIPDIATKILNPQALVEQSAYVKYHGELALRDIVVNQKRIPVDEDITKIYDRVRAEAKAKWDEDKKPIQLDKKKDTTTSDNVTGRNKLQQQYNQLKTSDNPKEAYRVWLNGLSPRDRKIWEDGL